MRAPLLSEASNPTWVAMCKGTARLPGVTHKEKQEGGVERRFLRACRWDRGQEEARMVSAASPNCAGPPR